MHFTHIFYKKGLCFKFSKHKFDSAYSQRLLMKERLAFSLALLGVALFVIIPTPDEMLIHPTIGYLLSSTFNMSIQSGIIWSIILYDGLGFLILLASIALGGEHVLKELNTRIDDKKSHLIEYINKTGPRILNLAEKYTPSSFSKSSTLPFSHVQDD